MHSQQAVFNPIYTPEQLNLLDPTRIPLHVSIVPDGNRRWAKKHGHTIIYGHRAGSDNLIKIAKAAKAIGIKVITFYLFSTENWKSRDPIEVRALMWLLESYLIEQRSTMLEEGVRLLTIGDTTKFTNHVQQVIEDTKAATAHCNEIDMVFALNYGARDEVCRSILNIIDDCSNKKISREEVTETLISRYLDTRELPELDLFIRTSGEQRMSNFLLWQSSYAELYFVDVLWPDFTSEHLLDAVCEFQKRDRRLGGA